MVKKPHSIVLYAICSFVFFSVISVYGQSAGPDAASMEALKKSLSLTADLDWSNPNPCEWTDVQCDKTGRITRIQLVQRGISGTLVPDLKNLSSLIILELMGNQLTGPIPSLAGLKSLQRLNIHDNGFISIPIDLFSGMSSLQTVILDNNPFASWEIPQSLKEATSLQEFSAVNCSLTGAIPDFFDAQTFPSLTTLHLSHNFLQGELPISLSDSPVQSLFVNGQNGAQKLNGSISILQNMTSLTEVWLHGNQFSGPIPDVSGLVSLRNFSGRDNQLTGIVPSSLYNSQSLFIVNLTNNLLQGPTPSFDTKRVIVDMTVGSNSFCLDDPGVPCDPRVDVLLSVVGASGFPMKFAQSWKGNDPCDNWLGITCSGGEITVVNFENMGLIGSISPSLANLTSLQVINFAQNSLTGTIPTELTTLPKLTTLDVSNNNLYGKLPGFRQNVAVRTEGNPDFGKDAPSKSGPSSSPSGSGTSGNGSNKKPNSTGIIAGSVVSVVVGLSAVAALLTIYIKKKSRYSKVPNPNAVVVHPRDSGDQNAVKITITSSGANGATSGSENQSVTSNGPSSDVHVVEAGNLVISIQVLREVTDNFSEKNILGRGGFGTVYKGELPDGTKIAVKRMESSVVNDKGLTEFKSEIAVLTKVRHRNLVALIGYCLDGNERLLVYEYMPQGTLSSHLFHWKEEGLKPLEWTKRLILGLDVARGVEYLHTLAHQSFIHRDLKPTNILLGDDMRAKVADFGLVRLAPDGKHSIETRLAGTFGYLAPEYAVTGRVTTKVDVFSFGVILMEMITGRRALDESQPEDNIHLVTWFKRMYINKESLQKSIDQAIEIKDETLTSIHKVAELAGHCCAREPHQRPDMGHVVNVLSSLVEQWKPSEREDIDDLYGIDYNTPLPQVVKKWRELEGSGIDDSSSSFFGSNDNTETSIPARPSNIGDTFASGDGR